MIDECGTALQLDFLLGDFSEGFFTLFRVLSAWRLEFS